jgi:D-arabinose 1-dehydrogenase-like Zn-dependent alcohol dehydrogenase
MVVDRPGNPRSLRCEQVPIPPVGPTDVLIKVAACGVCFHDIVTRNGVMKRGVQMPVIVGHEVAGVIEAVGPAATMFKPGDRVATTAQRYSCGACRECRKGQENRCIHKQVLGDAGLNGGYAEYTVVDQRSAARVPDEVPLEEASIVGCAICTELNAIRDVAKLVAGESVLVTGAGGGIGIHGVQFARAAGAYVIAVTGSAGKAEAIQRAGAHEVVVSRRTDDFSREVRGLTGGNGVDVVIDNVGTPLFTPTRKSLGFGGRWVMVGQVNGDFVPFNPAQLFLRHVSLLSATGSTKLQIDDALRMIALGEFKPIIHATLPLEEAPKAHEMVEQSAPTGRLVLKPSM